MSYYESVDRDLLKSHIAALNDIYRAFNDIALELKKMQGARFDLENNKLLQSKFQEVKKKYDLHYISTQISSGFSEIKISKRFTNEEYDEFIHYVCKDFIFGKVIDKKIVILTDYLETINIIDIKEAIAAYDEVEESMNNFRKKYNFIFDI